MRRWHIIVLYLLLCGPSWAEDSGLYLKVPFGCHADRSTGALAIDKADGGETALAIRDWRPPVTVPLCLAGRACRNEMVYRFDVVCRDGSRFAYLDLFTKRGGAHGNWARHGETIFAISRGSSLRQQDSTCPRATGLQKVSNETANCAPRVVQAAESDRVPLPRGFAPKPEGWSIVRGAAHVAWGTATVSYAPPVDATGSIETPRGAKSGERIHTAGIGWETDTRSTAVNSADDAWPIPGGVAGLAALSTALVALATLVWRYANSGKDSAGRKARQGLGNRRRRLNSHSGDGDRDEVSVRNWRVTTRFVDVSSVDGGFTITGKVLYGPLEGRSFQDLSLDDLLGLWREAYGHTHSRQAIEEYLDRHWLAWRLQAGHAEPDGDSAGQDETEIGAMSRREALEVLGFASASTPTEEEIQHRWRHLSKRVHPDAGGSDLLIKQVNAARDVLQARNAC